MKNVASIDIGSNSVVLSICRKDEGLIEILHKSHITELGKNLKSNNVFEKESFENTLAAIEDFKAILDSKNVTSEDIVIIATEACRRAENRDELFDKIFEKVAAKVELVTGEKEAELCLLAQKMLYSQINEGVLVDIGGSSTEVIEGSLSGKSIQPSFVESFKLGVVKLKDLSNSEDPLCVMKKEFSNLPDDFFSNKKVFFSAGSMTALASIFLKDNFIDVDKINGLCLGREFLISEIDKILDMTDNDLKINFPQIISRINTIKYGAMILKYFLESKCLVDVVFTTYGLRHGALIEKYGDS